MSKENTVVIVSPCVGVCALNEDDVCVGCYRTGLEISHWGGMSVSEKRDVLNLVKQREKTSYIG